MPVPAFGFSVGDIVAVGTLLYHVGKAVDAASEDFQEFCETQKEISLFKDVLSQLEQMSATGSPFTGVDASRFKGVLDEGQKELKRFDAFVTKYADGAIKKDEVKSIVKFRKRVPYTLHGKHKIRAFRKRLHSCLLTLSAVLQILNR